VKRNFNVINKDKPHAKNTMVEVDRPIHYPFEEVISMGEGGGGGGANS
jgi:hypothetical protein